jgi:hypothetical protein
MHRVMTDPSAQVLRGPGYRLRPSRSGVGWLMTGPLPENQPMTRGPVSCWIRAWPAHAVQTLLVLAPTVVAVWSGPDAGPAGPQRHRGNAAAIGQTYHPLDNLDWTRADPGPHHVSEFLLIHIG